MRASILVIFLFICRIGISQGNWALGAGGIYNFQSNGIAAELRAFIPVTERIAVSPQIHYFFPFNDIHEYYAGLALQYSLFPNRIWTIYPLAAAYYNRWQNSDDFTGSVAKPNNISEKVGIGIMKNTGCLRPYVEQRYDFKWKEFNLHLGVLLYFGDCYTWSPDRCPAYQ